MAEHMKCSLCQHDVGNVYFLDIPALTLCSVCFHKQYPQGRCGSGVHHRCNVKSVRCSHWYYHAPYGAYTYATMCGGCVAFLEQQQQDTLELEIARQIQLVLE